MISARIVAALTALLLLGTSCALEDEKGTPAVWSYGQSVRVAGFYAKCQAAVTGYDNRGDYLVSVYCSNPTYEFQTWYHIRDLEKK